jgi:hypothetical protein
MMGYDTQNYWVSGPCPLSEILNFGKHNISETGSVSLLRLGGGGETATHLGPLKRVNLDHWCPPSAKDGNRSSFRNVVFPGI